MSSHREAPGIAKDPVADSTDVYAFVSPDKPDTVTLIANYVPLQGPAGGPNFYEFGEDVLYEIHVDNNGDGYAEITYQFRFSTEVADEDTFLYNTGPIESLGSPHWNRKQFYTVTRAESGKGSHVLGSGLACPPATSARCPRRTTPAWRRRPCTAWAAAVRCTLASAPRASTSTSARSSTWATCARSPAPITISG